MRSFDEMLPEDWIIFRRGTFGNGISSRIASKLNNRLITNCSEAIFGRILKRWNRWLYVVLTKKQA
jgi:electron transfer flavoprotein alpha subunit